MKTYTVAQMREAEARAGTEHGIPLDSLMDKAGGCLANTALTLLSGSKRRVVIFCGKGNNGGDGYVCAGNLSKLGARVEVWGMEPESLDPATLTGAAALRFTEAGFPIHRIDSGLSAKDITRCDLIIDALLGTGLDRPAEGLYAHAINLLNRMPAPVLACDIPSGVDADTGRILGCAVRARKTLMMGLPKRACVLPPGGEFFGDLLLADIGLPDELIHSLA